MIMQEYVTRAVVLDKETRGGHADARYSFFTERYGKIRARATSSRKIVSKLAGHLEPGTLASVRIVEQHGTIVVDALAAGRVGGRGMPPPLADLAALSGLLGEWQPEAELWQELLGEHFSWARILAILGWDSRGAVCAQCNTPGRPARHFYLPRQEFFCAQCAAPFITIAARASRFGRSELLLIDD
jgi:recombinational DNA repair protein (RecF pathway)